MQDDLVEPYLSSGGKYVVYYDPGKKNYLSYEVAQGCSETSRETIPVSWTGVDINHGRPMRILASRAG